VDQEILKFRKKWRVRMTFEFEFDFVVVISFYWTNDQVFYFRSSEEAEQFAASRREEKGVSSARVFVSLEK